MGGVPGTTGGVMPPMANAPVAISGETAAAEQTVVPTGFASLDVAIPIDENNYNVYHFTTPPQSDLEITARPISNFLTARLVGIAWLAIVIALAWALTRRGVQKTLAIMARSPLAGLAFVALGVAALISQVLPLAGLVLGLVGICQLTSWLVTRKTQRIAA